MKQTMLMFVEGKAVRVEKLVVCEACGAESRPGVGFQFPCTESKHGGHEKLVVKAGKVVG